MAKFLRVLVVLIFILSIAALTLGIMLFTKREMLKGRAHKLEEGLISLARTLESEPPEKPDVPPAYPARDVSGVTAEIIENPTTSPFWDSYKHELESLDQPTVNIGTDARRRELMNYYKIDPATAKPERHPVTNLKIDSGPGTTQGIIDYAIERASEQYNLLTETRQQLQTIREELITTIRDLNQQKKTLRDRLVHIVALNNQIAELNRTIEGLRRELQQANDLIEEQKLRITDLEADKLALEEENDGLKIKTEEQTEIIKDLRGQLVDIEKRIGAGGVNIPGGGGGSVTKERVRGKVAAGNRGRVISVDERHLFVVMEMEDSFFPELLSIMTDGSLVNIELLIKRDTNSGSDKFITKVVLTQIKPEQNLAIGEILQDWQQGPIKEGDIVFFQ